MPRTRPGGPLAAMALGLAAATAAARAADMMPLLVRHRRAVELARNAQWHEAAKVYGAFAAVRTNDPYAPLASILEGVVLRREVATAAMKRAAEAMGRAKAAKRRAKREPGPEAGDQAQAAEAMARATQKDARAALARARAAFLRAAKAPDTPFGREMQRVARRWLARLQMEHIDAALRQYWVDKVEYPARLEALVQRKLVEPGLLIDPWGKPFQYTTGRLRIAPEIPRQKYTLSCAASGATNRGLQKLLAESATFGRRYVLTGVSSGRPKRALLALAAGSKEGRKSFGVAEGEGIGTARVVQITPQAVVLVDGEKVAIVGKAR